MRSLGIDTDEPDVRARPSPRSTRSPQAFDDGQIDGVNGNDYVERPRRREPRRRVRLVGRRRADHARQPGRALRGPGVGRHALVRQLHDPVDDRQGRPRERVHQLLLRPGERRGAHRRHPVHLAGRRACRGELTALGGDAAALVDNPLVVPTDEFLADAARSSGRSTPGRGREVRRAVRGDHRHRADRVAERDDQGRKRARRVRRGCCSGPGCSSCSSSSSSRSTRCSGCRCRSAPTAFSRPGVQLGVGELRERVLAVRRPVPPVVPVRGDGHAARAAHRVPARVRHRVPRRAVQERAARPRRRPVLHELPDPHARVEDDPRRPGRRSSALLRDIGILGAEREPCCARRSR